MKSTRAKATATIPGWHRAGAVIWEKVCFWAAGAGFEQRSVYRAKLCFVRTIERPLAFRWLYPVKAVATLSEFLWTLNFSFERTKPQWAKLGFVRTIPRPLAFMRQFPRTTVTTPSEFLWTLNFPLWTNQASGLHWTVPAKNSNKPFWISGRTGSGSLNEDGITSLLYSSGTGRLC